MKIYRGGFWKKKKYRVMKNQEFFNMYGLCNNILTLLKVNMVTFYLVFSAKMSILVCLLDSFIR
ncbi:hypothetical protein AKG43_04345 [Neisseria sp. 74A18]|nr:hypothetical protein AKG43_04345 [Neisseria sp. 74A18]